jgi:T-complex protein 1 subunit zeta
VCCLCLRTPLLAHTAAGAVGSSVHSISSLHPRIARLPLPHEQWQIKLTKDGNVLLHEMQIQHPTAIMIARTATAQDDVTGDGTTSCVLFVGELLKYAERYISEGVHPRIIADGFELAKSAVLPFLDSFKVAKPAAWRDRELLCSVARMAACVAAFAHVA